MFAQIEGSTLADSKHEESFKVIDRRPFTADCQLRPEALEEEERFAATPAPPSTEAAGKTAAATASGGSGAAAAQTAADAPKPSRSFQLLVDFLARNAALLLGGYADPQTGQAILDLDGAREMIDMLDALREKTLGNLAPEDDSVLVEVLGSLKLSFLEISKAASAARQEKAKAKS